MKKKMFMLCYLFLICSFMLVFIACSNETDKQDATDEGVKTFPDRYVVDEIEQIFTNGITLKKKVSEMTPIEKEYNKNIIEMVFELNEDTINHIVYDEQNPKKFRMDGENIIVLNEDDTPLTGQVPIKFSDGKIILTYVFDDMEMTMNIIFVKINIENE